MLEVESHLNSRVVFAPRHLAPLPKDLAEKQRDAIDFVLNAPDKSVGINGDYLEYRQQERVEEALELVIMLLRIRRWIAISLWKMKMMI